MELTTLPAQAWRDAMVSEDTEAFLSVVRLYLGPVPTPYNKHTLVARLEAFLKKPETGEVQAALLDSLDARVLGALAAAGPSPEAFLRELLADERGAWELALRLSNLRDRLVLFRAHGPQGPVLAVTPALASRLGREADLRGLLGCSPAEGPLPEPGLDADTICAVASVLFHEDGALRRDGRPTRRVRSRLLALVPELSLPLDGEWETGSDGGRIADAAGDDTSGPAGDNLDALLAGFRGAGFLADRDASSSAPDMERLSEAAEAWGERLPFFLAAASLDLGFRPDGLTGPPAAYAALAERARMLESVAAALPSGSAVSSAGLRRLALLSCRSRGTVGAAFAESAAEALLRFGLARRTASGIVRAAVSRRARRAVPASPSSAPAVGPVLVVEASHAVRVMPEADPAARVFAGTVARLESRGEVWSCVLDRKSARRALDAGFGADRIARTFESLSGKPLPQSLAFSLEGWEKEYFSVRLYSGFVLAADGPARTRAENAPALSELRGERVAEGVWLLDTDDPGVIRAALEKAGIHAPRIRRTGFPHPGLREGSPRGTAVFAPVSELPDWTRALGFSKPEKPARPQDVLDRLRSALERLDLPDERKAELAERITRRLILTEDQLGRSETDGPALEAGALDYLGKVRVVERVLRSGGAILEILHRRPDGEPERFRARPLELEKTEKGLVLRAADAEDGSVRVLPVSAMSHVKRIKTALFGEEHDYNAQ